jgi:ribonuclease HII
MHLYQHENEARQSGYLKVAGVDEAGRGPLAGPVVVAACILPSDHQIEGLNDSKQLTEKKRLELFNILTNHGDVVYSVSILNHKEIDTLNILQATMKGMKSAVRKLRVRPDFILVDGNRSPKFSIPYKAIVDGDALSASIAAASIIAKVTRDQLMVKLDKRYPQWHFFKHKGYATKEHFELLCAHGPSPIHRLSFAPVKKALLGSKENQSYSFDQLQLDLFDTMQDFSS